MDKVELKKRLLSIDQDAAILCGIQEEKFKVVVIGGAAFLASDLTSRQATDDIDIFEADRSVREILARDPNFNFQCNAYANCMPYNFEDRLRSVVLETKAISFLTPSLEDLAVLKLYRWEDRDMDDLTNPNFLGKLDWELLDYLVRDPDEAPASRTTKAELDQPYKNMLKNYQQYTERYRDETKF